MSYGVIISNEKGVAESLSFLLRKTANVRVATTAQEGIAEIVDLPADFAILDSYLKDQDPVSKLGKLLRIQKTLPVIVLVPSIHSLIVNNLKQAGAYAILEKPFDRKIILDIVEKAIERKRLMSEIAFLKTSEEQTNGASCSTKTKDNQHFYHEVLRRFSKAISHVFDHHRLLNLALETVTETFNTGKAMVLLYDRKRGHYIPAASIGYQQQFISSLTLDPADVLPVWLSKHNQIFSAHGLARMLQFDLYQQVELLEVEIITGLFAQGKMNGILLLGKKITGKTYSDDDVELLSILVNYLAVAIENALLYRRIAENQAHNEKVLNSLKTGIVTIDSRGLITTFNQVSEKFLGLKREELIAEKIEKIGSQFADILLRTMSGEVEYRHYEFPSPIKKKPLAVTTSPMRDEKGNINGAIMVLRDLSEVKKSEEQARELKGREFGARMASRLTHKLKNILVPIKTFSQLLPQRYKSREFREEFHEIVTREIDGLNDILDRVTQLTESPPPSKIPQDIDKVIDLALKSLRSKIDAQKAIIDRADKRKGMLVPADENLLSEALTNVIDNALEAVNSQGKITISTGYRKPSPRSTGYAEIIFRDNGKGLDQEEMKDVFMPFITSKADGLGLGLSIAQRIIQDHHGTIEMTSSPGKGSTVKITLPVKE